MTPLGNCITIDNPNVPILSPATAYDAPYGKFLSREQSSDDDYQDSLTVKKAGDMYLPNFSLRFFEGKFMDDAIFVNQNAQGTDLLGSCLFMKGRVRSTLRGQTHGPESYNWSQNFKFDPHNEFIHFCPADTDLHFIHFSYSAKYFNEFLPDDEHWSEDLKNRIHKRERILGDHFPAITLAQEQALRNINECPIEGKLGHMMIETSIIQIILIQMYALFQSDETSRLPVTSVRDIEVVKQLKDHLKRTFLQDHCLRTLAREFGTNTNKLMTTFKKVFGKSIFEFIGELRMDHAMTLLRDRGLLVTEVARTLGYKNPNHFSSAFKRRYGINPSDVK
jgi:AraC-like DNA-binding protein